MIKDVTFKPTQRHLIDQIDITTEFDSEPFSVGIIQRVSEDFDDWGKVKYTFFVALTSNEIKRIIDEAFYNYGGSKLKLSDMVKAIKVPVGTSTRIKRNEHCV